MKKQGYKSINSTGMKKGGCECGCQAITKSNHPDPFVKSKPKPLKKSKPKPLIIKKQKEQKHNPY
tara:strand:- start:682 stop:876 length:195 start_codon:yes stop_codon:yes gene_type:complete